jgi:hypothetical protein
LRVCRAGHDRALADDDGAGGDLIARHLAPLLRERRMFSRHLRSGSLIRACALTLAMWSTHELGRCWVGVGWHRKTAVLLAWRARTMGAGLGRHSGFYSNKDLENGGCKAAIGTKRPFGALDQ